MIILKGIFRFACIFFSFQVCAVGQVAPIILPDLGEPESTPAINTQKSTTPLQSFLATDPNANPVLSDARTVAAGAVAPPVSINVGNPGAGASLGANASSFRFEGKDYLAHVGVKYASPKSNFGYGINVDGAALLSKTVALGINLSGFTNTKEAVLSGVWMPEDTNLKMKLSTAYMWGQQNFDFYSGNSSANLNQASYYFSGQYVVPKEKSDYLHLVGISNWGTKANQTNTADPVYLVTQTANAYQIMMDPRKLSTGTLQGGSFDTQIGVTKQVVTKVSLGYESLTFPYSDGTQDINKTVFQNYLVQYQPVQEVIVQAGYKMGAALNNLMLSVGYNQLLLTGFKNNGNNGVISDHGLMLSYRIPLEQTKASAGPLNLLARPESIGNSAYVLRDAFVRPVQLPQTFLAKVDTTAVKTLVTINKPTLPAGVIVNTVGDIYATIGAGGGAITSVTKNGVAISYANNIQMSGSQVVIRTKTLAHPGGGVDNYAIGVTDSAGLPYVMSFAVQP